MIKHILVPLDGSELAESALPAARFLAAVLGATATLLHVIEADAPATIHGERHLTNAQEAEAYLEEVRKGACPPDFPAACHVHAAATGNVAQSIVEHQDELAPDLIVMCTHGGSGIRRLLLGSIAQQVVASGHTPVLLIRPEPGSRAASFAIETLLAPVDGKQIHEQGLHVASDLAKATGARLQLLSVVPTMNTLAGHEATMGKFMPGTLYAMLQLVAEDLQAYLRLQVSELRKAGVNASASIAYGDPAPEIAGTAETCKASMIVLGTHGKAGNEAFWTNSVGAKVQAQTQRPLLLVPIK